MLSLRRSLFDRLLHLPLPKLWDMKTGGILSRLTGDVDTTTGLLQMAIVSPAISIIRLLIAVVVLLTLNWRLALTALAIIPGVMLMSFAFRAAHPAHLPLGPQGRGADRRPRRRNVLRHSRRPRVRPRSCGSCSTTCSGGTPCCARSCSRIAASWSCGRPGACCWRGVNVVIVWYGGYLNIVGRASIGDIMAFQWYTFLLLNPVWNIVNSFSELQRSLAAMERVFEVLAMEDDKPDRPGRARRAARRARDPLRGRRVRISRGPAGRARLQRRRARRIGGRPGGPERRRQDDGDGPGRAVSRPDAGTHPAQRHRHPRLSPAHLSRPAGHRPAGRLPVRRIGARQHRLRPARRHGRRGRRRRPARQRARVHRQAARPVRDVRRRARRQALGRPAAAAGHRPGDPGVAADPHPRRGHQQPGHGKRAAHPGVDGDAARRANHLRDRPSPLHDPPRRPDPADGRRPRHRARHPRATHERARRLLPHGPAPDGREHQARARKRRVRAGPDAQAVRAGAGVVSWSGTRRRRRQRHRRRSGWR